MDVDSCWEQDIYQTVGYIVKPLEKNKWIRYQIIGCRRLGEA